MKTVVCQEWDESERGWGVRPDGASLHLTEADLQAYIKEYWDTMPKETPDEYSRPGGKKLLDVDDETHRRIKKSKNGIRLWETEYHQLGKVKEPVVKTKEKPGDKIAALKKQLAELEAKDLEEHKANIWKRVEELNDDDLTLLREMISEVL